MNPDFRKCFEYENNFYLTSNVSRIGKLLAQYELYKMIVDLPGHVVECGVFKGASLIRWATFRDLLENAHSRMIIGFDTFGRFPAALDPVEQSYVDRFTAEAGDVSLSKERIQRVLDHKKLQNTELVVGDINETVPDYIKNSPHLKIALLHIDTDLYEPAAAALKWFYDAVVPGGIIVLDDYGTFPGETQAVDEFIKKNQLAVRKLPLNSIPAFIRKP